MSYDNFDRNAAAVGTSLAAMRCEYSGLTTTSSFGPQGGATASATAGSQVGEVDTSNVVSHYIPPRGGYKIVLWAVEGALSATGAASTTVTFESPKVPTSSTFYEVGRIAAAVSTAAAFQIPLVASAQPSHMLHPLAVGFPGSTLKVKLAGTSISAVPVTVKFSYVRDNADNDGTGN